MYAYQIHGLKFSSELEIPEFATSGGGQAGNADVTIRVGTTPAELSRQDAAFDGYQFSERDVLLTVPRVARYFAEGDHTITVEAERNSDPSAVRLYLIASAMASVLYRRGLVPLHGAAVVHNGRGVVFLGDSGAGKSTLATLLSERGFELISDDVLVIRPSDGGEIVGDPGPPLLKLWPQSLDATETLDRSAPFETIEIKKYRIHAPDRFSQMHWPISRIYFLGWLFPTTATPEIVPVNSFQTLMDLRANAYRGELIEPLGQEQRFMDIAARLVKQVQAFTFHRAMDLTASKAQVDALVRHMTEA